MAQRIAARRTIWLNLQVEYPRETRFQLGQREKAVYYYLLDKDREWFEKNSPARTHMGERSKMKKRRGKGKVFWKERDSEMLRKIVSAVEEIRNLPEVPRITIGKLIRHIGESKPVKTIMPSKLPKTWRFVNEVAETIDQRTCRAIWEFAKVYAEKGEVPTMSTFYRRARINWKQCQRHREEINRALEAIRLTVNFGHPFPDKEAC